MNRTFRTFARTLVTSARAFDWCQNQRPWMTLKGRYAVCFKTRASFGAHHENLYEDRPILTATKMLPNDFRFWQYKVYADIRGGSQDLLYVQAAILENFE